MSVITRNRRCTPVSRNAPSFQLHNVPERTLLPMAAVGMDGMGNTKYAPEPTTTTATITTHTTATLVGGYSNRQTGPAGSKCVQDNKKGPDDDDKKGGDRDGQSQHHHRQQQQHHTSQQPHQDDSGSSSSCCGSSTTAACVIRNALYLGGEGDANSAALIRKLRIRRILNVADEISLKGCWLSSTKEEKNEEKEEEEGAEKLPPASVVSPVSVVSVVSSLSSNHSEGGKVVVPWSVEVKHIKLRDHSDEDISGHFDEAIRFIREGVTRNEPVLVHCRFGVSRSATIVIAYLMKYGTSGVYPSPKSSCSSSSYMSDNSAAALGAAAAPAAAAAAAAATNNSGNNANNSSLPLSPLGLSRPLLLPPTPRPMSYQDSFDYVKARRPQVSPNLGFVLALHRLDSEMMMNRSPMVTASPPLN